MSNNVVFLKVRVQCPRDTYRTRQVPLQYIPLEDNYNYATTAGCDFLDGSEHCQNCIRCLLKIFTAKRDYAGETIYMYNRSDD